jgi:hypothetical protein
MQLLTFSGSAINPPTSTREPIMTLFEARQIAKQFFQSCWTDSSGIVGFNIARYPNGQYYFLVSLLDWAKEREIPNLYEGVNIVVAVRPPKRPLGAQELLAEINQIILTKGEDSPEVEQFIAEHLENIPVQVSLVARALKCLLREGAMPDGGTETHLHVEEQAADE